MKKALDVDTLAQWSSLPEQEAPWIRGLLDAGSECYLTVLPCMREELLMPLEVFDIVNSGHGRIIFYANVVHALLCPRHLVFGNAIYQHSADDKVAAIGILHRIQVHGVGKAVEAVRLFARCFSLKCEVYVCFAFYSGRECSNRFALKGSVCPTKQEEEHPLDRADPCPLHSIQEAEVPKKGRNSRCCIYDLHSWKARGYMCCWHIWQSIERCPLLIAPFYRRWTRKSKPPLLAEEGGRTKDPRHGSTNFCAGLPFRPLWPLCWCSRTTSASGVSWPSPSSRH